MTSVRTHAKRDRNRASKIVKLKQQYSSVDLAKRQASRRITRDGPKPLDTSPVTMGSGQAQTRQYNTKYRVCRIGQY